jgi:hypothetical protein
VKFSNTIQLSPKSFDCLHNINPYLNIYSSKCKILLTLKSLFLTLILDNGGRLKPIFYDNHDDFTFPIVIFQFISSNTPTVPSYSLHFTTRMLCQGLCPLYRCSGQSSAMDAKAIQTRLLCSYVKVIATKILRSSHRNVWQLRNIHFTNDIDLNRFRENSLFPPSSIRIMYLGMSDTQAVL